MHLRSVVVAACLILAGCATSAPPTPPPTTPVPSASQLGTYTFVPKIYYLTGRSQEITGQLGCSGSLIAPSFILTAAHCITNPDKLTAAPANQVFVKFNAPNSQIRQVAQVIRHPDFKPTKRGQNPIPSPDIALLQLTQPVKQPVLAMAASKPTYGTSVMLAGWPCVKTTSSGSCFAQSSTIRHQAATVADHPDCSHTVQICVTTTSLRPVATSGYSGGPMIVSTPTGPRQAGVISAGTNQATICVDLPRSWIAQYTTK